jgi:hypothetical protein
VLISLTLIILGTAAALAALILVRRFGSPPGSHYRNMPGAPEIFGVVGTGFAVLLAFVIFGTFESYHAAREAAGTESVAVRQLFSTAQFFPSSDRESLQAELICYGRAVVNDEWPKMAKSEESTAVTHWVEQLDSTLQTIPATDEKAVAVFHNWFAQSEARQEGRRGRISEAAPFVPGFVWGVLIALLVLVVAVQVLFADPDVPLLPQAATVIGVAASLVAGLTLVWILDRPFNDRGAAIPPTRMTATVQTMEQAYGSSAKPLPCDVNGQPME